MSTPNNVDLFTRVVAEMFDEKQLITVPTAGQAFFGNPANASQTIFSPDANAIDIDIIKSGKTIAALIPRGMVSRPLGTTQKNIETQKFSSFSRKFPLSEEEGDIECDKLLNRMAGESATSGNTRYQRARVHAARIHMESIRRTVRMFEVLAFQSILTGKQDAIIGTSNTDLQYDFLRDHTNLTDTPGTKWDAGGVDIIGDIDGMCFNLESIGNCNPDAMFIGGGAFGAFIKDTTVKGIADNPGYTFIRAGKNITMPAKYQRWVDSGWIFQGWIKTFLGYELWIFTYNKTYTNLSGVNTLYMPTDSVLITDTDARADRYFGPPESLPIDPLRQQLYLHYFGVDMSAPLMPPNIMNQGAIIDPAMFYCDVYKSADEKRLTIRTQSAPIFATTQTDAFGVLNSVLT
jgi:hypothetical protein